MESKNVQAIDELLESVTVKSWVEKITKNSKISGMTVVFAGKLEKKTRDAAEEKARSLGAKTSGSVSTKTDLVIAGPKAGSKLADAQKFGVKVIDEDAWLKMIEGL